jgi:hypothetical protein
MAEYALNIPGTIIGRLDADSLAEAHERAQEFVRDLNASDTLQTQDCRISFSVKADAPQSLHVFLNEE